MKKKRSKSKKSNHAICKLFWTTFGSYSSYLKSDTWAYIRKEVFASKGRLCCCGCGRNATQVHHGKYDEATMFGRTFESLFPICSNCHDEIEFTDGKKNGLQQANDKLRFLSRKKAAAKPMSPLMIVD